MNPQELSIRNFLNYDDRICIVTDIDSTKDFKLSPNGVFFCEFLEEPKYYIGRSDIENYEPIPLTKEWLLKFGFVNTETGWEICHWKQFKFSVILFKKFASVGMTGPFGLFEVKLKYVHELQNLFFALTKEELVTDG